MDGTLFGWIHISDIHFGQPGAAHGWDQVLVLDQLREDLARARALGAPAPDAILVTGDIAFSGREGEYEKATAWLLDLAKAAGLGPGQVFVIPGNHDVDRSVDKRFDVGPLVKTLRAGDPIDSVLDDPKGRELLAERMRHYLRFAAKFAPACLAPSAPAEGELFWVRSLAGRGGLTVRLCGLNTSLLCSADPDEKKLQLGMHQLTSAIRAPAAPGELVVVLTHHPLRDWLSDGRKADEWLMSRAHLHLSGHVHEADSEQARHGAGTGLVRVAAGAAHEAAMPEAWIPSSHGYNFAAVVRGEQGRLRLRIWPRRWAEKSKSFRVDADTVGDGERHAEHDLAATLPGPASGHPLRVFFSYAPEDDALRKKLEKHLVLLKRDGLVEAFTGRSVGAGDDWRGAIDRQMMEARIVLLLLSDDYLASDYCYDVEMEAARKRNEAGEALVLPVLLRDLDLAKREETKREPRWFERLQRVPRGEGQALVDGKPVTSWANEDEAWAAVAREIRAQVNELRSTAKSV
jgi:predicted MPP superfamily phosphohydrolase